MPGIVTEVSAMFVLMIIFLISLGVGEKISNWHLGSTAAYKVWTRMGGPVHSGFYAKINRIKIL